MKMNEEVGSGSDRRRKHPNHTFDRESSHCIWDGFLFHGRGRRGYRD